LVRILAKFALAVALGAGTEAEAAGAAEDEVDKMEVEDTAFEEADDDAIAAGALVAVDVGAGGDVADAEDAAADEDDAKVDDDDELTAADELVGVGVTTLPFGESATVIEVSKSTKTPKLILPRMAAIPKLRDGMRCTAREPLIGFELGETDSRRAGSVYC
jgi:hypothetical protein